MTRGTSVANSDFKFVASVSPTSKISPNGWSSTNGLTKILDEWEALHRYLNDEYGDQGIDWIVESVSVNNKFIIRFRDQKKAMMFKLAFNSNDISS